MFWVLAACPPCVWTEHRGDSHSKEQDERAEVLCPPNASPSLSNESAQLRRAAEAIPSRSWDRAWLWALMEDKLTCVFLHENRKHPLGIQAMRRWLSLFWSKLRKLLIFWYIADCESSCFLRFNLIVYKIHISSWRVFILKNFNVQSCFHS